jgi:biopolymer transport protein ExbB/TolQ
MDLSIGGLWHAMGVPARIVLIVMVLMLFWCVYIAIERALYFLTARGQSRQLAGAIGAPLKNHDIAGALKLIGSEAYKKAYLGAIVGAALQEYANMANSHGLAAAKRALEKVATEESAAMRKGMNMLATTGSTTPFVGLVGTIFGIINAFGMMAEAGGGDLTQISGGIAEALVSTAVGIIVAIIAIWFYNYFNALVDGVMKDISVASADLVDWMEKDLIRRNEAAAAK